VADEVILFGDIEGALITYLTAQLAARSDTATVANEGYKPSSSTERPARLVVVRRIGGRRLDLVRDSAIIEFHCYDTTDPRTLSEKVRGIVNALKGDTLSGLTVYRVEEWSAPSNQPHPKSNNPRYVFTATVHYRGAKE
jgi:hypothetical protein